MVKSDSDCSTALGGGVRLGEERHQIWQEQLWHGEKWKEEIWKEEIWQERQ